MSRSIAIILAAVAVIALGATAWSLHAARATAGAARQIALRRVDTLSGLLAQREAALAALRQTPFAEADKEPFTSLLIKLRRDGVARSAAMKQHLDAVAVDTAALAALLHDYLPDARTEALRRSGAHFGEYATLWLDRYAALLELFMGGGAYPAAELPPPDDLSAALQAERQSLQ